MWHLYVVEGRVVVPTVALTEAGFYWNVEPCAVVDVADRDGLKDAIQAMIQRGHPKVPTPSQESFKRPVVLKFTTARSWRAFEKKASFWMLSQAEGHFLISRGRLAGRGGWQFDPNCVHQIYKQRLEDVSASFAEIVQRSELRSDS